MTSSKISLFSVFLAGILLSSCTHSKPNVTPVKPDATLVDPVKKAKADFELNYGFLITEKQVTYYKASLGVKDKENKIFKNLKTVEDFGKFVEVFWKVRDPDPNTQENEYKTIYDKRIQDVKDNVFMMDVGGFYTISGFRFDLNGGLRGEAAHVYLIFGKPPIRIQLLDKPHLTDLMLWVYIDEGGNELFRFLFYKKHGMGDFILFRNYFGDIYYALSELGRGVYVSEDTFDYIIRDLEYSEDEYMFLRAVTEFSPAGLKLDEALEPPEPAEITVQRAKPRILGQPSIPKDMNIRQNKYYSVLPAYFRVATTNNLFGSEKSNSDKIANAYVIVRYDSLDWVLKDDKATSYLKVEVVMRDVNTKQVFNYNGNVSISVAKDILDQRWDQTFVFHLKDLNDMINLKLPSGSYSASAYMRNAVTYKYGGWLLEFEK